MRRKFPYHEQEKSYTCGAASMRMALEYLGIKKTEKQVVRLLGTNKVKGTWEEDFPKLVEKYRLNYVVKHRGSISDLKRLHKNGYVVIVCYYPGDKIDHYSVIKKIDNKKIYLYDPWYGSRGGPNESYKLSYFEKIWKTEKEKDLRWLIAIKKTYPKNY